MIRQLWDPNLYEKIIKPMIEELNCDFWNELYKTKKQSGIVNIFSLPFKPIEDLLIEDEWDSLSVDDKIKNCQCLIDLKYKGEIMFAHIPRYGILIVNGIQSIKHVNPRCLNV